MGRQRDQRLGCDDSVGVFPDDRTLASVEIVEDTPAPFGSGGFVRYRETVDHDRVDVSGVMSTVDNSDKLKILLVPSLVAGVEVMVV